MQHVRDGMIFELYNGYAVLVGLEQGFNEQRLNISAFVQATPVTAIKKEACKGANSIKHVLLPHTLREIGDGAFANCDNLEVVQLLNSSDMTPKLIIGSYAFAHCKKLSSVHIKTEMELKSSAFAYSYKLGLLDGCVKRVGSMVFEDSALDMLMLANDAEILKDGLYGSKIEEIICIRNAVFHSSAVSILQIKDIKIHCPANSNVVDLAYLGVNIWAN